MKSLAPLNNVSPLQGFDPFLSMTQGGALLCPGLRDVAPSGLKNGGIVIALANDVEAAD